MKSPTGRASVRTATNTFRFLKIWDIRSEYRCAKNCARTDQGSRKSSILSSLSAKIFGNADFIFKNLVNLNWQIINLSSFVNPQMQNLCFKKGVNSLKTDNAGTYIIHDAEFRTLTTLASSKQYLPEAPKFLAFPCGLLRGALFALQGILLVCHSVERKIRNNVWSSVNILYWLWNHFQLLLMLPSKFQLFRTRSSKSMFTESEKQMCHVLAI